MMNAWFRTALAAIGSLTLLLGVPANAATFVLSGSSSNGSIGNSRTYSDGGVTVRATAWSINNSGVIRASSLGRWTSGLGVNNPSNDNSHTVDNSGWADFILFQFDTTVMLDNATFNTGWHGMTDTDATIGFGNLALPFNTSPSWNNVSAASALAGFSFSDSVAPNGNNTRNVNLAGNVGNSWIIGASRINIDQRLDGFKLARVSATPTGAVPEPSTWALMLLGFGLVGGMLRRRRDGAANTRVSLT